MNVIRGNIVSTNQRPENVLARATDLTDDQKAQTRENIGAVGQEQLSEAVDKAVEEAIDEVLSEGTGSKILEGLSQGRSTKYSITSGGWKRILNVIRGSSGAVNMCLACNSPHRSTQILSFDFSGYVKYPAQKDGKAGDTTNSKPILIKKYENRFGVQGTFEKPQARITKVRIGYPAPGTNFPALSALGKDYEHNPINCYVDVYVEVDVTKLSQSGTKPELNLNYAGYALSHNCEAITKETNASDTGIYNETLTFYEESVDTMTSYLQSGPEITSNSWADIQKVVKSGQAKERFPVGTQFLVRNSLVGTMLYDVVAHDHYTLSNGTHSMTLMCHDIVPIDIPYDVSEALYVNDTGKEIRGNLIFNVPSNRNKWLKGYYVIRDARYSNGSRICLKYKSDSHPDNGKPLNEHVASTLDDIWEIEGPYVDLDACGYDPESDYFLGTAGSLTEDDHKVNHISRVADGSNDYLKSVMRQVIFKSGTDGAGTPFNTPYSIEDSDSGHPYGSECNFVDSFDPEFLAVIGEVTIPCVRSKTYEAYGTTLGSSYTINEKFFLPSHKEITGQSDYGTTDKSKQLEYFIGSNVIDRVKYLNGSARPWFTRTPYAGSTTTAHTVSTISYNGWATNYTAKQAIGVVPMCNIVG